MFKKLKQFDEFRTKLRRNYVSARYHHIEPYKQILEAVNSISYTDYTDEKLKQAAWEIGGEAAQGEKLDKLLPEVFALVKEACGRVLGLMPYDVQVIAAAAMHRGNIVEMQTGEGKTLAAVFPAFLNALSGKGVHVLTFNDYLAKRDAEWMGPVYRFLGLTVGYVQEGMSQKERKEAYACHITYGTAKEVGFDYLRSFLAMEKDELVQRPFHFAIVDEADSILIDEARIPLVIAGDMNDKSISVSEIANLVRGMMPGVHYYTDEYERNVHLTDFGIDLVERSFHCGNLFNEENLLLLSDVNNALHAKVLLHKDVDYIVREGEIELVDEFTGRIADKRQWPDGLQAAIEAKEGLMPAKKGEILFSVSMQNFIKEYPKVCGMTGTAQSAAEEFEDFYNMNVVVIPTNRPCIRKDHPDLIFTHRAAKYKTLFTEIYNVHKTGRPVLIGTCSVEESEFIACSLKAIGIQCQVLNAKNDEVEAGIIAKAGKIGVVTVSTNMAGRGTDIKLGGEDAEEYRKVVSLGGLYIIGTNRHESVRIDNQLRGRSGRQGDSGESRFFVSMEDDLMQKYKVKNLIPVGELPALQDNPIDRPVIIEEMVRAQRIIEGQNFDIRKTLLKYSELLERQRCYIYKKRQEILLETVTPSVFEEKVTERYSKLRKSFSKEVLDKAERQVTLYYINRCWMEYLAYVSYVRESIHLYNFAAKAPLDEYNRIIVEAFEDLRIKIEQNIVSTLNRVEISENGIDMEKEGMKRPSSTWTYLIDDGIKGLELIRLFNNTAAGTVSALSGGLMIILALYNRFKKDKK